MNNKYITLKEIEVLGDAHLATRRYLYQLKKII